MENLKFEDVPNLLNDLIVKVESLERAINQKKETTDQQPQDQLLTIDEACKLLNLCKQSVYGLSFRNEIPKIKLPGKKKLYFSRESLMNWLKSKESKAINNVGGAKYEV